MTEYNINNKIKDHNKRIGWEYILEQIQKAKKYYCV